MKKKKKTRITNLHLENDVVNNKPKLILTDESGVEWVLSHHTICSEGGGITKIVEKSKDWYFNPKNKKS